MALKLEQVLRMKEGTNEFSYARASYAQKQALIVTKSMKEEAIKNFYLKHFPSTLSIVDLGCSSAAQNTFSVVFDLIQVVEEARMKLRREPLIYQVQLNDLPGNDFNTLFKSLSSFQDNILKKIGDGVRHCFVNCVPGSFYGRLFPDNILHFVHSSYSLQWLSQEPLGIEENKRNIYLVETSSPGVLNSYYEQFTKDFSTFLSCRSKEVVVGGKMVLSIVGREDDESYSMDCSYMWELLSSVLNDLTFEGIIDEEKLNTFNIPNYYPSSSELKYLVEREGSFHIDQVHLTKSKWVATENDNFTKASTYGFVKCVRSIAETLLMNHFEEIDIDDIFERYHEIAQNTNAIEKRSFTSVTVSLTKQG